MPHINLSDHPGILAALDMRPDIAEPLKQMTNAMLLGPSNGILPEPAKSKLGALTLTSAERELIGAYVSKLNTCQFCATSHSAIAARLYDGAEDFVDSVICKGDHPDLSPKMRALLTIARKVQGDAKSVSSEDIKKAKQANASESDIYDTVIITGMFCMFNRIVDGLSLNIPEDKSYYSDCAKRVQEFGYRATSHDQPSRQ
jgi:uncharacterized peroxidase-related enzyme